VKRLLFILAALVPMTLAAQFEVPRLSQYLNNGLSNNPAYAGSRDALSITGVRRSLYTGFEGNPTGYMAALHTPLKKGNVALGLTVENKSYPGYSNTGVYSHYAYRIWLGGVRLSMGLRAGLYNYQLNYSELMLKDGTDPAFNAENGFKPNFGAGVYLYNNRFFAGLSVPYFLNLPDSTGSLEFDYRSYRYLLTGGYLFDFTDNFKLKASTMVEYSISRIDVQGGVNFILFGDMLWLGGLYRYTSSTLTSMVEFQISRPLRLGIAYDYSFTNLSRVSNGSFEVMFRYEFNFKADVESPFYF
jgi:type IX secretion system PorP/SprF family membrane protein